MMNSSKQPSKEEFIVAKAVSVSGITAKMGRDLKSLAERCSCGVTRHRAHIVWCSATGMSAPEIAHQFEYDIKHVRLVIHGFNSGGLESLEPKYDGGRNRTFDESKRAAIVDMALASPTAYGMPFTRWSLRKLACAVVEQKVVDSISPEGVRAILQEAGVSHQRTKTWKESNDPRFVAKRRRIRRLYKNPPADGRVVCLDEFGPLNIQPHHGSCWARKKHPDRIPATYSRTHGVRHMLAALDLSTNKMYYRIRERKRRFELLDFLKVIRRVVPEDERIYLVLDNFSPHLHKTVRKWCRANKVSLVFTATNASWMNRIECHFAPIREFVLNNSNYSCHAELALAMRNYIRWRNRDPDNPRILVVQNRVKVA